MSTVAKRLWLTVKDVDWILVPRRIMRPKWWWWRIVLGKDYRLVVEAIITAKDAEVMHHLSMEEVLRNSDGEENEVAEEWAIRHDQQADRLLKLLKQVVPGDL